MTKTNAKFVLSVYIGRFCPFHNGHAEVLKRAQSRSDLVLVLIGSINQARTPKNPWTFTERKWMIDDWVNQRIRERATDYQTPVEVRGVRDYPYNDQLWIANVHNVVQAVLTDRKLDQSEIEIRVTGADRDDSTFYLKYFPEFVLDLAEEDRKVSRFLTATSVREVYFGKTFGGREIEEHEAELLLKSFLPLTTTDLLDDFKTLSNRQVYEALREEHVFNVDYRKPYTVRKAREPEAGDLGDPGLPHPVVHNTIDSIVFQTGYVLLIKRKRNPGKGLWALPGGHLDPTERLLDGAIRELREETKLKVPEPVLRGSLVFKDYFDYPDRSLRGRTITHGFVFKLADYVVDGKISLPKVKGSDDAEEAMWVPIDTVLRSPEKFFEDHWYIIECALGKL